MPRKTTVKSEEKPQCHVHERVYRESIEDIHEKVCVKEADFPLTKHTDGKYYCLFHLPIEEKDAERFEEIFRSRLNAVEEKITAHEKLSEKEKAEIESPRYDFSYVWFPSEVVLSDYKFSASVHFNSATFSALATFSGATFSSGAYFNRTTFSAEAFFFGATFSGNAYFWHATFSAGADFLSATFLENVNFYSAIFSDRVNFETATFSAHAFFHFVKFTETSQIFFTQTHVCQILLMNHTIFAGYVTFAGNRDEKVFSEDDNRKAILDLQNARLEKPDRISFHRVRLRPSWFVNCDSRKMIFTDISWDKLNSRRDNSNIFDEIESLEKREVSEPSRLLEIACRQLAVNAEENNRYGEASEFRYMTMETKRLEQKWQGRLWTIHWWYKFSSDYGENWKRAFIVLLLMLFLVFPIVFSLTDFQVCPKDKPISTSLIEDKENRECREGISGLCNCRTKGLNLLNGEAFIHSLATATFQNVEHRKPVSIWAEFWVILEKILAPLQAALLALAIRRKFMR